MINNDSTNERKIIIFCILLLFLSNFYRFYNFTQKPKVVSDVQKLTKDSYYSDETITTATTQHYHYPNRTYGHVHMAKTAGTSLNGILASEFERVCGHKGYSYDAYQFNKRLDDSFNEKKKGRKKGLFGGWTKKKKEKTEGHVDSKINTGDAINRLKKNFNRGRVPFDIMSEIGFEDCQYISLEASSKTWKKVTESLPPSLLPLELHVPCRDPLSHLMSMCNYRKKKFDCDAPDLKEEISNCLVGMSRFDTATFQKNTDIELKCFEATPIEPYIEYMSHRLQAQRAVYPYFQRDTNKPRNKEKECIWQDEKVQNQVLTHMRNMESYFAWCEDCLGSKNDLLV